VPSPRDVGVVIVAAGRGVRLGGDVPKQFLPLAGVPMLLRTLRAFTSHPSIAETVIVLPAGDPAPPAWLAPLLGDALRVVPGGAERMDSVAAGMLALGLGSAIVLVHDAARPFVSQETISAVIEVARGGEAAIAAIPVTDTLKECAATEAVVARTVPRALLWRAQTPQAFPRAVLIAAHAHARAARTVGTDDASLVEAMGGTVRLVPDSARNFKVTTADDFALAELVAAAAS
jgi:2-C-methyl-D-erythritol 4-phosphate cytidylyltransferase